MDDRPAAPPSLRSQYHDAPPCPSAPRRAMALDVLIAVLAAAGMTALATATRSFWGDEILSLEFARGQGRDFLDHLLADYHPPLYFLLLKGWLAVFGDGEAGLRVFQGLQTVALLTAAAALVRRLLPARRVHPFLFLIALSPLLWLFAPMLRYYALAAALALAATAAHLRWLDDGGRRPLILRTALWIAILYTDYPTAVVIAVHIVHGAVAGERVRHAGAVQAPAGPPSRGTALRQTLAGALAAVIAFLPWMAALTGQIGALLGTGRSADLQAGPLSIALKVGWSLYAFVAGETVYPVEFMGVAITAAAAMLAFTAWHRRRDSVPARDGRSMPVSSSERAFTGGSAGLLTALVFTGILFTALLTTVISTHTSFIYTPSRTLHAAVPVLLLLALGYERLRAHARVTARMTYAVLLAGSLYGILNLALLQHVMMPVYASPWRTLVRESRDADAVLSDEALCYRYYASRDTAAALLWNDHPDALRDRIHAAPADTLRIDVILTERESTDPQLPDDLLQWIRTHGKPVEHRRFVVYDDTYRWIKRTALRREPGEAKFHRTRYMLPSARAALGDSLTH